MIPRAQRVQRVRRRCMCFHRKPNGQLVQCIYTTNWPSVNADWEVYCHRCNWYQDIDYYDDVDDYGDVMTPDGHDNDGVGWTWSREGMGPRRCACRCNSCYQGLPFRN